MDDFKLDFMARVCGTGMPGPRAEIIWKTCDVELCREITGATGMELQCLIDQARWIVRQHAEAGKETNEITDAADGEDAMNGLLTTAPDASTDAPAS